MIEMIDRHLHGLLSRLSHVRPAKRPNDSILMQFASDCPSCGGSGKLSIALAKSGKILINCHGRRDPHGFRDCVPGAILGAIGLTKSALFPPPIGDGQPPYDKRTLSHLIATWLRTSLREPTPAADVIKMFRVVASESLVQKVRTEIGVEMIKFGFPAIPYWLIGMPVPAEAERALESQRRNDAERSLIASDGAGFHRGGIDQPTPSVDNQLIANDSAGSHRDGTSAPEIVRDSASVDPRSVADLCGPPQRRNGRNPHVIYDTSRGGAGVVGTRNSTTRIVGSGVVEGPASEASPTTQGEERSDEHHAVAVHVHADVSTSPEGEREIPGGTFDITVRADVIPITCRADTPNETCPECGGLPAPHLPGQHRITCSEWRKKA